MKTPEQLQRKREASKRWASRNPELVKKMAARYRAQNRETARQRSQDWYRNNRVRALAGRKEYKRNRYQTDPAFRVRQNLQNRVWDAVVRNTGAKKTLGTLELLGCSIPELRAHLEQQFRPGMTWENYGPVWHIDHICACAKFDLLDPVQQRECFHYTNLQPLFAVENLRKGDK